MRSVSEFNPFDPEVIETPWDFFAALRRDAPLYELPNKAYYLISRYEDVMQAVMDTEIFSSNLVAVLLSDPNQSSPQMLNLGGQASTENKETVQAVDVLAIADPPNHTRQRRVSNRAFTMRRVAKMEDAIRALSNRLIDAFIAKGHCDWVSEFAVPLPMTIIIELLGLPLEDMPQLKKWSDASVALLSGINTAEELMKHGLEVNNMIHYLAKQYDNAKLNPGDNVIGDLIREAAIDSEALSRNEIISILIQLLTAGNETTTSLIGSAMQLLLKDSDLQNNLRQHPEKIDAFIEEALRLESPFHGHFRVVTRDTNIQGKPLAAGSRVMLLWSSANRDEQQFTRADATNIERERPRSHVAFGYGIHHCIGAALARMEAQIAIQTILQRTQHIQLSPDNDFTHVPSLFVRSLKKLTIEFK